VALNCSFCGAIEMAGVLTLKTSIIPNGMALYNVKNPIYLPGPIEPRYHRQLTFQGISVTEEGQQLYLDSTVAYRNACLNAIEHLKTLGYSGEQAYLLMSACPCEGHIGGIVDIPNACCTLGLPLGAQPLPSCCTTHMHCCLPRRQSFMPFFSFQMHSTSI
jgi:formamidase